MLKKRTLLAMAVAALVAFAVPAAAQASGGTVTNVLEEEAQSITGISEDMIWTMAPEGWSACDTVHLQLNRTGSGTYHGNGTAEGGATVPHAGECLWGGSIHMAITSLTFALTVEGGGKGTADFTYTYTVTTPIGNLPCHYEGNNVAVTYAPTGSEITVNGTMVGKGPQGCSPGGTIHGTFDVTDEFGETVSIH